MKIHGRLTEFCFRTSVEKFCDDLREYLKKCGNYWFLEEISNKSLGVVKVTIKSYMKMLEKVLEICVEDFLGISQSNFCKNL